MAASKKVIENSNRLRYVRALERFHNSMVSYLGKQDELTKEKYNKKIDNALKVYKRVEEVELYKGELQELQKLVKKMIAYQKTEDDVDNIKEDILYSSNQLDKSKNARRYKKDKHSKSKYEDWE